MREDNIVLRWRGTDGEFLFRLAAASSGSEEATTLAKSDAGSAASLASGQFGPPLTLSQAVELAARDFTVFDIDAT